MHEVFARGARGRNRHKKGGKATTCAVVFARGARSKEGIRKRERCTRHEKEEEDGLDKKQP